VAHINHSCKIGQLLTIGLELMSIEFPKAVVGIGFCDSIGVIVSCRSLFKTCYN